MEKKLIGPIPLPNFASISSTDSNINGSAYDILANIQDS